MMQDTSNPLSDVLVRNCPACGVMFVIPDIRVLRKQRYCSRKCYRTFYDRCSRRIIRDRGVQLPKFVCPWCFLTVTLKYDPTKQWREWRRFRCPRCHRSNL